MVVALIVLLTVLSGGIGTITGFGTSTIMVPILLIYFPLPQTLLLVGIIHWFGDVWKILLFRRGVRWKLIFGFGVPGIITSFAGALATISLPVSLMPRILGVFIISYVVFIYANPSFKMAQNNITAITGGMLSGFFAGIFGIGGAVRSAFLSVFDLEKSIYISTTGAIALFIDSSRLITYITRGARLETQLAWGLLAFIPASLLGAKIAQKIVDRIPQRSFRFVVAGFLLLISIKLILFPK